MARPLRGLTRKGLRLAPAHAASDTLVIAVDASADRSSVIAALPRHLLGEVTAESISVTKACPNRFLSARVDTALTRRDADAPAASGPTVSRPF